MLRDGLREKGCPDPSSQELLGTLEEEVEGSEGSLAINPANLSGPTPWVPLLAYLPGLGH